MTQITVLEDLKFLNSWILDNDIPREKLKEKIECIIKKVSE